MRDNGQLHELRPSLGKGRRMAIAVHEPFEETYEDNHERRDCFLMAFEIPLCVGASTGGQCMTISRHGPDEQ